MITHTFEGTLTDGDSKKHIEHQFEMVDDATLLEITFEFSPHRAAGADYPNQMSLSLFDRNGSRGARHNNKDQSIRLMAGSASPGYFPGALTAGLWTVVIDTHRILPPDTITYCISVTIRSEPISDEPQNYTKGYTAARGQGWYQGDLHGHTLHSDGSWDVRGFVDYAREIGLDFVTLTDHNTVSALPEIDSLSSDDLLTMGGMELTTYYGHALALNTRQWHEWRIINGNNMHDLAQAVMDSGAFYVIAHPRSPGDPSCTGCRWEFDEMMPGIARAVEVWNEEWSDHNEEGLQLYYQWLNEGLKLVATAGTDIHRRPADNNDPYGYNVVFADALSEMEIISAIRKGHLYLSSGPMLKMTAEIEFKADTQVMMGDTIDGESGILLTVEWTGADDSDVVRLIAEGKVVDEFTSMMASSTWALSKPAKWYVAEIRDRDGNLRAITNPIWVE